MNDPTPAAGDRGRHTPPDDLGPMLRAARERKGLSLRALARRAGLSPGFVCMIEQGQRCPSVLTASALADVLTLGHSERAVLFAAAVPGAGRDYPGRVPKDPPREPWQWPPAANRGRGASGDTQPPSVRAPAEPALSATVAYQAVYEMARRLVRQATLTGVALVTRASDGIDIPAADLLEDTDPAVACQILAGILSAVLEVTLPDRGKGLLISVSRQAIED